MAGKWSIWIVAHGNALWEMCENFQLQRKMKIIKKKQFTEKLLSNFLADFVRRRLRCLKI